MIRISRDVLEMTSVQRPHQTNASISQDCAVLDVSSWDFIPWDNPDNVISQDTEQAVDMAVGAVCLPVLFVISFPSNILNMMVFGKQGLHERINLCLFYLSMVDLLHMFSSFVINVDRFHPSFTQSVGPVLKFIIDNQMVGLLRGFVWLSGFNSALIACERCFCVVSPLHSHTVLKTRTMAVLLAAATVLILTGSTMVGLRWDVICVFDPVTNKTSDVVYDSKFYEENKAHLDILTFFVGSSQLLTYVTVVSVTTIVTSVKLKKMVVWRGQTSTSTLSSREVALTRTLIAISILYVVCSVPAIIIGLSVLLVPDVGFSGRYYNFLNLMLSLVELASFTNATFNFFVYCFLGSRYKESLYKILRCRPEGSVSATENVTAKPTN